MTSQFSPLTRQTAGLLADPCRSQPCQSQPGRSEPGRLEPGRLEPGGDLSLRLDDLVRRVQLGDASGMLDLYEYILAGLRPYLARQLRPQDYRDKVHSVFVDVVVAIQQGQLRDPGRLMGFARTIARRKVSLHIDAAASERRNLVEIGSLFGLASPGATPEQQMVSQEQREIVQLTLARLSGREAEILSRFYLQEQTEAQIRSEMDLTHTQYRLLKWRSKVRFEQLSRRRMASRHLQALCAGYSR